MKINWHHSTHINMAFIGKYFSRSVVRLGASYDAISMHDYIVTVLFISHFLRQKSKWWWVRRYIKDILAVTMELKRLKQQRKYIFWNFVVGIRWLRSHTRNIKCCEPADRQETSVLQLLYEFLGQKTRCMISSVSSAAALNRKLG
jgi:hypothetical protein